ncbi:MAG: LptF/LptG family permease, partial [Planctomycetales bacterium]|nr:LptF/LptG family permease [Planctomycetales bacterium]
TIAQSTAEIAYGVLKSQRRYDGRDMSICVQDVQGRRLVSPLITVQGKNLTEPVTIMAAEAELVCDPATQSLVIRCRDGQAEIAGKATLTFQGAVEHSVSLDGLLDGDAHGQSPIRLPGNLLDDEAAYEAEALERLAAERAAEDATEEDREELAGEMAHRQSRLRRLQVEPHRRLAGAMTCLTFVLIGVPVSLTWRQGDILTVFFVCFLPILVVFYPLMVLGQEIATRGFGPPQAAWIANAVLAAAGAYLYQRWSRR